MEHVNTLQMYKDLIDSGMPASQAEANVISLNSSFDSVATKEDLKHFEIITKQNFNLMESNLKIFFTFEILAVCIFIISFPKVMEFLSHIYKLPKRTNA